MKTEPKNLTVEERALIGDAFLWAITEGIIVNIAVMPLVEKFMKERKI